MNEPDIFSDRNLSEDENTIEKTLNYLRLNDRANANREYAVGFLKFMQRFAFHAEKVKDFKYDDFFKEYKKLDKSD